jgi:predicted kinase
VNVVRRLVYVSGAPGSGKSTLAEPLAASLGFALLGKDIIKETLHGVLGPPDLDRARSRELGAASMELLWALAARSPQVLIEANFRPYSDYERDRLTALGGVQVEVHCACPPELAVARYNARPRHPVHVQTSITTDFLAEFDRPVGIGALVTVDTTAPVDVPAIAGQVRSLLLSAGRSRAASGSRASPLALSAYCCYLTEGSWPVRGFTAWAVVGRRGRMRATAWVVSAGCTGNRRGRPTPPGFPVAGAGRKSWRLRTQPPSRSR